MIAWEEHLSRAERWALVRYLKGFSDFFAREQPDPPLEIPEQPTGTPELVREGRFVYAVLKCWQCHGPLGRGDGPSAGELQDDWGRKIKPYDFTRGEYRNGSAPSDLYRTLLTGLNGTPMPAFERDVVAFPGGTATNIAPLREVFDSRSIGEIENFLSEQPTESQLRAMSEEEIQELVQHRLWALVYYVGSLERGKGFFYRLFAESPDLPDGNRDE